MGTVFFGSGSPMSVRIFEGLVQASRPAVCVVPQSLVRSNPLVTLALASGAEVERVARGRWNELRESVRCDLAVVGTFPWKLPAELFEVPERGTFNVHASLLPRHRGSHPLIDAYLADDRETGVTIHRMTEEFDAGPVAVQKSMPLGRGSDYLRNYLALADLSAEMISELVEGIEGDGLELREQDDSEQVPVDRSIDLRSWPVERIWHVVSGLRSVKPGLIAPQGRQIDHVEDPILAQHDRTPGTVETKGRLLEVFAVDGILRLRLDSILSHGWRTLKKRIRTRVNS